MKRLSLISLFSILIGCNSQHQPAKNDKTGEELALKTDLADINVNSVYEAVSNVDVSYLTHHMAPYTGGGEAMLPKGERVIINTKAGKYDAYVYCTPVNYSKIEKAIIPEKEYEDGTYSSYTLCLKAKTLLQYFKRIELKPLQCKQGTGILSETGINTVIIHLCNDDGIWKNGFTSQLSAKWTEPEKAYINWHKNNELAPTPKMQFQKNESRDKYAFENEFRLGNVQFIQVEKNVWVANMLVLRGIETNANGVQPMREVYLVECLERVAQFARLHQANVHIPKAGYTESGGNWNEIESIINHELIAHQIKTAIYITKVDSLSN